MKIHCHIPKLYEFAIYVACDYIVEHGAAGLIKPIPYVLYLKSQVEFVQKYGNKLNIRKLYDITRKMSRGELNRKLVDATISLAANVVVLDHVVLKSAMRSSAFQPMIRNLVNHNDPNVDDVIECLRRFVSRCTAAGEHEFLMNTMSAALRYSRSKAIRQVLIEYGGHLDPNDFRAAIRCGMSVMVKTAIDRGQQVYLDRLKCAIESGDVDTVKLLMSVMPKSQLSGVSMCSVNAFDLEISFCEQLLSLGVFISGKHHNLYGIRSIPVIKWLLDHRMVHLVDTLPNVIKDAARYGGAYIDVLHYLIEQQHLAVPRDIFTGPYHKFKVSDLGVFDYLLITGVNVKSKHSSVELVQRYPLLIRYWLDNGMKPRDLCYNSTYSLFTDMQTQVPTPALKFIVKLFGINLNIRESNGSTMIRSMNDHFNVLLECGADVDVTDDEYGNTLLHDACKASDERESVDRVMTLLKHGANPNCQNNCGQTPLHLACGRCDFNIVTLLVHSQSNINIQDDDGRTPLDIAVKCRRRDKVKTIKFLVNHGAMCGVLFGDSITPLHWACSFFDVEFVELLLSHHADVNARDARGHTALHVACAYIDHMVDCGAIGDYEYIASDGDDDDIGERDDDDNSSNEDEDLDGGIIERQYYDSYSVVQLLIKHGVDVNAADVNGMTALHMLCDSERHAKYGTVYSHDGSLFIQIAQTLIDNGADVNARTKSGKTPLQLCNKKHCNCLDLVGSLLNTHNVDVSGCDLNMLLFISLKDLRIDVFQQLIDHGGDASSLGSDDCFQLLLATCTYDTSDVKRLLSFINFDWSNIRVHELLNQATPEVLPFLIKQISTKTSKSIKDKLLYDACTDGTVELIKLLLECGCDATGHEYSINTPLRAACERKCDSYEVVRLLVEHGAK